jgi:hypothetical protein
MKEKVQGQEQPRWQPTAAFYESDTTSRDIRAVCIQIIDRMDMLRYGDVSEQEKTALYGQLDADKKRLVSMNITAGMHKGIPLIKVKDDPVLTAEYLAGRLLPLVGERIIPASEAPQLYREGADPTLRPLYEQYAKQLKTVNAIGRYFDAPVSTVFIQQDQDVVALMEGNTDPRRGVSKKVA